ncbi:peptidase [Roseovarius sp. MBR-154]
MAEQADRRAVIAAALAWRGTPWHRAASLRGVGCDCVGLIRGVVRDVTGVDIPAPPWSPDWPTATPEPLIAAARRWLLPLDPGAAHPGDVVTLRLGHLRAAHAGILVPGGIVHATERAGVVRVSVPPGRGITTAWAIPAAPEEG